MHDPGDLPVVEGSFQELEIGDVAADDGDAVGVVAEDELEARPVVAEVVADDLRAVLERSPCHPGAEAAEDAGDEEALAQEMVER